MFTINKESLSFHFSDNVVTEHFNPSCKKSGKFIGKKEVLNKKKVQLPQDCMAWDTDMAILYACFYPIFRYIIITPETCFNTRSQ